MNNQLSFIKRKEAPSNFINRESLSEETKLDIYEMEKSNWKLSHVLQVEEQNRSVVVHMFYVPVTGIKLF